MAFDVATIEARVTADTTQFNANLNQAEKRAESFTDKLAKAAGAFLAFRQIAAISADFISAFAVQEQAVDGLTDALRLSGAGMEAYSGSLQRLASELQEITAFGDEATMQAMSMGINMGIPASRMEDCTKAAMGLAAAYGMDLNTAMSLIAKAQNGQTEILTRYGIKIDETKSKQEQFAEILEKGKAQMELAEADTASEKLKQLSNNIGDAKEAFGEIIVQAIEPATSALNSLTKAFNALSPEGRKLALTLGAAVAVLSLVRTNAIQTANAHVILAAQTARTGLAHAAAAIQAGIHAGALATLKGAMVAGAAAARGFFAAMGPIGWATLAISGLVAVWQGLKGRIQKAREEEKKFFEELKKEKAEEEDAAKAKFRMAEEERKEDYAKLDRLKQLAQLQRLNNSEMEEAKRLNRELAKKYGPTAARFNDNGSIVLNERLEDTIRKTRQAEIDSIRAAQAGIIEAADQENGVVDFKTREKMHLQQMQEKREEQEAQKQLDEQRQKAWDEYAQSRKEAQDEWKKFMFDSEYADANRDERIVMLNELLKEKEEAFRADIGNRAVADFTKEQVEAAKELHGIKRQIRELEEEDAREIDEEEQAYWSMVDAEKERRKNAEQEAQLRKMQAAGRIDDYNALVAAQVAAARKSAEALEGEYKNLLRRKNNNGTLTAEERLQAAMIREELSKAYAEAARWAGRTIEKGKDEERMQGAKNVMGSFSAAVLDAMLGASTPEKETAKNTRKAADYLFQIREATRGSNVYA